jgi:hypothetical protein
MTELERLKESKSIKNVAYHLEMIRFALFPISLCYVQPMVTLTDEQKVEYREVSETISLVEKKIMEIHAILGTTPNYKAMFEKTLEQLNGKRVDN